MALDAVVYPQPQGHLGYGNRDSPYALSWRDTVGFGDDEPSPGEWDPLLLASLVQNAEEWEEEVSSKASPEHEAALAVAAPSPVIQRAATTRRKRRRLKVVKNEEEIESQRMTHIAVERNRRRQMNEYLAVLRSLMPPSYAQRGDQASIVGGAINFTRELEQLLQSLEVQKSLKEHSTNTDGAAWSPFAGFFSFPQYSTVSVSHGGAGDNAHRIKAESTSAADIEASMVEGHASLKVQARRRPRQLLRLATGLQQLGLTTLHLNVSTAGAMVMYSFSLKVEDECKLSSVEEIATAANEILGRVQQEAGFS
ncbi:transcription factor bHLH94-like [Phragmites australis]|uniref:transcription factor bHLH94-like n=1 Tax=Phragmites australis TaxID=29695 RepID=UPI002D790D1A|nr:transcription factor bHLH94-like [Phragmites australis]